MRASSPRWMRTVGSTLGSLSPLELASEANCRAASQFSGPWPAIAFANSANIKVEVMTAVKNVAGVSLPIGYAQAGGFTTVAEEPS